MMSSQAEGGKRLHCARRQASPQTHRHTQTYTLVLTLTPEHIGAFLSVQVLPPFSNPQNFDL